MEENPLSINIDGIVFTLFEKTVLSNGYIVVRIQSLNLTGEIADFWVYRSNSELGFWRLCSSVSDNPEQMYKGDPDEFNYDYIQTTFIHLLLQFFINARFEAIFTITDIDPNGMVINIDTDGMVIDTDIKLINDHNLLDHIAPNKDGDDTLFVLSNPLTPDYKAIVDDNNRIIQESPFIDMYHEAKCGEQLNIENLQEFSVKFQKQYTVSSDLPVDGGKYNYEFEGIIKVDGQINCITLSHNIRDINPLIKDIELYYLNARLCGLQNKTYKFHKNIEFVCSEDTHIMPFLLIPFGTRINILGLYSKYILVGAYICKLFDYAQQCSPNENRRRQCTINYTHIGYRYNDLFPFKKEEEQISKKQRSRGITKKGKRSKRKTRKQQMKEIDKREKYRKERRSKNKNKSKKYGVRSM